MNILPRFMLSTLLSIISFGEATAQVSEPGGTPQATMDALNKSDEYAWKLFFFLNHQAKQGIAGEPDASKTSIREYDADRAVVWETWALASGLDLVEDPPGSRKFRVGVNKSEVFKSPATQPVPWAQLDRGPATQKVLSRDFKRLGVAMGSLRAALGPEISTLLAPTGTDPSSDETRMNRSTYETVRTKRLWSVEGLEAAFEKAANEKEPLLITFEQMSKEVKARWIPLSQCNQGQNCPDKQRYHWRTLENPATGQKEVWGLAALHVITRDLPNWFWADFGHYDCEAGVGACAQQGRPAETPLVDLTTRGKNGGPGPAGSNGIRAETVGTKWENYRLRGTQIDFSRPDGRATILSNPLIEATFQFSSCISCHAYASVGRSGSVPESGSSLPIFARQKGVHNVGSQAEDVGRPKCERFYQPGGVVMGECPPIFGQASPLYLQSDFLWSIPFRAFSENP